MSDIAEQICLAIDEIVNSRLQSVNYNSTVIATITDASEANIDKYVCSTGTAQFVAYSKGEKFKNNDSVLVTIPNNDYSQQKIIIGRYIEDNSKPFNFVQPFDLLLDVTGNLIKQSPAAGLLANDERANKDKILVWNDVFAEPQSEYTRLGLQGQFRSWLKPLKATRGDYGYSLIIYSQNKNIIEKENFPLKGWLEFKKALLDFEKNQQDLTDIEKYRRLAETTSDAFYEKADLTYTSSSFGSYLNSHLGIDRIEYNEDNLVELAEWVQDILELLKYNALVSEIKFSSADMYGDPYNYQSFYEQEEVYDITGLTGIAGMDLYFYQTPKSFYNILGQPIPHLDDWGEPKLNNLFTKDPYISLGYDLTTFKEESATLYSLNSGTYILKDSIPKEENRKRICLRWLHDFGDKGIQVVTPQTNLDEYEIRWYRYTLGKPSADEYSGVYWERLETAGNVFEYELDPRVSVQEERVKVIILYGTKIIRSNIITFTNEKEVVNQAVLDLLNGLSLHCRDDSNGNYYLYGQNNNLLDTSIANEIFTLEAMFNRTDFDKSADENLNKTAALLEDCTKIIWDIPLNNTMLVLHGFNYNNYSINEDDTGTQTLVGEFLDGYGTFIGATGQPEPIKISLSPDGQNIRLEKDYGDKGQNIAVDANLPYLQYRIKRTYNSTATNNIIKCSVQKDGIIYSATKEFGFGIMGTNGTDTTLVIEFEDNKVALTNGETEDIIVTARLYDSAHREIDITKPEYQNVTFEFNWADGSLVSSCKSYFSGNTSKVTLVSNFQNLKKNQRALRHTNSVQLLNDLMILQVVVKGYGDYDLTGFKAVPVRASKNWRGLSGPVDIVYSTTGYPDYYREPYKLVYAELVNQYDVALSQPSYDYSISGASWGVYNPTYSTFAPTVNNKKILQLPPLYVKDSSPVGIQYKNNNTIYWTQPLVILQNRYPSAVLNSWDGEGIQLNEDEGYILASAIGAGKKEANNTFSGVILGDWSNTNTANDLTAQTGVYGFHQGAVSYALKEDGTAFIGKSGKGRIYFDGDKGIISAGNIGTQIGSVTDLKSSNKKGMFIDLTNAGHLYMHNDSSNFIELDASAGKTGYPFKIGTNFKVKWDGSIEASNGSFAGTITSSNGEIGGWTIGTNTLSGGSVTLDSSNGTISGAIIQAGELRSNSKNNRITLNGYLKVGRGELGYLETSYSHNGTTTTNEDGIGMIYDDAQVKAGNNLAGLKYTNNNYVTALSGGVIIGAHGGKVTINASEFAIAGAAANAANQTGIYARFA